MKISRKWTYNALPAVCVGGFVLVSAIVSAVLVDWPARDAFSTLAVFGAGSAFLMVLAFFGIASVIVGFVVAGRIRNALDQAYFAERLRKIAEMGVSKIISSIEHLSDVAPQGYQLCRTGCDSDEAAPVIAIPADLAGIHWAGQSVRFEPAGDLSEIGVSFAETRPHGSVIGGERLLPVPIPRQKTKSGKERNILMLGRWLRASSNLVRALENAFPDREPIISLEHLVTTCRGLAGRTERTNAKIGLSPEWIQSPEFPNCPKCRKRMTFILEISGAAVGSSAEGMVYVFGCEAHPEKPSAVVQFG